MAQRVRITVAVNGNQTTRSVGIVQTWEDVMTLAANKLRLRRPSRLFTSSGHEISRESLPAALSADALLVVSRGEDYVGKLVERNPGLPAAAEATRRVCQVRPIIVAAPDSVEDDAVAQLNQAAATLSGVRLAVGMPDLHPGKGFPIGAVFGCQDVIHPFLIGGDIGCGMSLLSLPLEARKATTRRVEQWASTLDLEGRWSGDIDAWLARDVEWPPGQPVTALTSGAVDAIDATLNLRQFNASLGTVGGGNHFAELLRIERVVDAAQCSALGVSDSGLFLLVRARLCLASPRHRPLGTPARMCGTPASGPRRYTAARAGSAAPSSIGTRRASAPPGCRPPQRTRPSTCSCTTSRAAGPSATGC
jgi:hypothetical protein